MAKPVSHRPVSAAPEKPDPKLISPEGKPLELMEDAYGKPIYVEEFQDHDGKPKIWYNYDSNGRRKRWERKGHGGVFGSMAEGNISVHKNGRDGFNSSPGPGPKACGF